MEAKIISYMRYDIGADHFRAIKLNKNNFLNLGRTILELNRPVSKTALNEILFDPSFSGKKDDVLVVISRGQFLRLLEFIQDPKRLYAKSPYAQSLSPEHNILAFSYGEESAVNEAIANNILEICKGKASPAQPINVYAQWEIADPLKLWGAEEQGLIIHRIPIRPDIMNGSSTYNVSGFYIKDIKRLASLKLIPEITENTSTEDAVGILKNTLKDSSLFDRIYPDLSRTERKIPGPVLTAIKILKKEQKAEIEQLNLALLMAFTHPELVEAYIDSAAILEYYLKNAPDQGIKDVFLFAQAWHAPRLLNKCDEKGLRIAGGSFVDEFSPQDRQTWVRDPLSWLIRESGRELIRAY